MIDSSEPPAPEPPAAGLTAPETAAPGSGGDGSGGDGSGGDGSASDGSTASALTGTEPATSQPGGPRAPGAKRAPARPAAAATAQLLERIDAALRAGDAQAALEVLGRGKQADPALENARGVCLLRLGRIRAAIDLYQGLVLHESSLTLLPDVPAVFVTNFATALLLDGRVMGCLATLTKLGRDAHPAAQRLEANVERWRRSLGWWDRLKFSMYGVVARPVELDEPAGELHWPAAAAPEPGT